MSRPPLREPCDDPPAGAAGAGPHVGEGHARRGAGERRGYIGRMAFDPGLVERIGAALHALGERTARQKNVFGGRGFLLGKSTFVIAWTEGLLVKTPPGEYAGAVAAPGVTPFAPDGTTPMGNWVVVSEDAIADDPELTDWVARGLRAVTGAPAR